MYFSHDFVKEQAAGIRSLLHVEMGLWVGTKLARVFGACQKPGSMGLGHKRVWGGCGTMHAR